GTNIGATDVDRQDAVVRLEHPWWGQMRGTDEARFVGIAADRHEVDGHLVGLEDDSGATDGELAVAAVAKAAAYDDAFGIAPSLELEETANDERELLREVLDRALQDTGSLRIAFGEQRIQRLLAQLLGRLVAERVFAGLAQGLAPVLDDIAEGA